MCEHCGAGPECAVCGRDYTIDQNGPDGGWRVWWLANGYTQQRHFRSKESAEYWVEWMSALEAA